MKNQTEINKCVRLEIWYRDHKMQEQKKKPSKNPRQKTYQNQNSSIPL